MGQKAPLALSKPSYPPFTKVHTHGCFHGTGTSTGTTRAELIDNPQKKDHADPPEGAHGLCMANPARVAFIGDTG